MSVGEGDVFLRERRKKVDNLKVTIWVKNTQVQKLKDTDTEVKGIVFCYLEPIKGSVSYGEVVLH